MRSVIRTSTHRQSGITMIEILVTLVVVSIGLLGAAALQVSSIKQTTGSGLRTQALILTQDMINRILANRSAVMTTNVSNPNAKVTAGDYTKTEGASFPSSATTGCLNGSTPNCTASEIAKADLFVWSQQLKNTLPVTDEILKDSTFICLDDGTADGDPCENNGSLIVVQVAWAERSSVDDTTIQTLLLEFEP